MTLFQTIAFCSFLILTTPLLAQTDTLYYLGSQRSPTLKVEIDERIARMQKTMPDAVVKFTLSHQKVQGDSLLRYGGINIIGKEVFTAEEDLLSARLDTNLPSFTLVDLAGDSITNADLAEKVVLLNFWFTRCKPCIEEMPALNALQRDYRNRDVLFISFAPEAAPQVQQFLNRHEFTFRHVPNADDLLKTFGTGFPKNILVDRTGKIRYIGGGLAGVSFTHPDEFEVDDRVLREQLDALLR